MINHLTSKLKQQALAACNATTTFSLKVSSSMLMVFGSIWQKVKRGVSSGNTLRTKSSFRGRTNSPKLLLDKLGSGPEMKTKIVKVDKTWSFICFRTSNFVPRIQDSVEILIRYEVQIKVLTGIVLCSLTNFYPPSIIFRKGAKIHLSDLCSKIARLYNAD